MAGCSCYNCTRARRAARRSSVETIAFVLMVCALGAFAVLASMPHGRLN